MSDNAILCGPYPMTNPQFTSMQTYLEPVVVSCLPEAFRAMAKTHELAISVYSSDTPRLRGLLEVNYFVGKVIYSFLMREDAVRKGQIPESIALFF